MATLTWRGGGSNNASNPNDWTPIGAPRPGDDLRTDYQPQSYTMNIRGNDLADDTLSMNNATLTANLSHQATMTAVMWLSNAGTFNLSQKSTLDLSLISGAHVGINTATVNITGTDNFTLHNNDSNVAINLAASARWNGTVDLGEFFGVTLGKTTVNGAAGSTWNNNGASLVSNTENFVVNANVVGTGSFNVANTGLRSNYDPVLLPNSIARMEFAGSVGANQVVLDSGLLVLDKPGRFAGHVVLSVHDGGTPYNPLFPAEIDLIGLANADSYTYKNDMLSIYSGKSVIDRLHLTDQTLHGFVVEKGAGSVNIVAILDPAHPSVGLPIHM